jgi:hypothetical protein
MAGIQTVGAGEAMKKEVARATQEKPGKLKPEKLKVET